MKLRKAKPAWGVARQLSQCRISTRTANKRYAVAERVYCQTIQPNPPQPNPVQPSPTQPNPTQPSPTQSNRELSRHSASASDVMVRWAQLRCADRIAGLAELGRAEVRERARVVLVGMIGAGSGQREEVESAQRRHCWAEYGPGVAFEPRVLVPEPAAALCSGTARGEHSKGCT